MGANQTIPLEEQGAAVDLSPGDSFSIQDPDKVWLVLAGELDLFTVDLLDGKPSGARHHLMRVEAGGAVPGFDPAGETAPGLIAHPAIRSRVLSIPAEQLRRWMARSPSAVVPLIEKWVRDLSSAVATESAPRDFQELKPGETIAAGDNPCAILPLAGVVWVRLIEGNAIVPGGAGMAPLGPGTFFPVTRSAWLECAATARAECFSGQDWAALDPQLSGLRVFQQQLFACLVAERRRRAQRDAMHMKALAESDARVFEQALYELAAPLREKEGKTLEGTANGDPLFEACRIVGKATGVEIRPAGSAPANHNTQEAISAIAQASRLRIRQVALKGRWWRDEGPAMAGFYGEDKRAVALVRRGGHYELRDPQARKKTVVNEKVARQVHGLAWVFYRPFPASALTIRDILFFGLRGCRHDLFAIVMAGLAGGLIAIITPLFTGLIFDSVIPGAERGTLAELGLFLVVFAVASALFSVTRSLAVLRLEGKMDAAIQAAVWDRLLALPVSFFRNFTAGDLAKRSLGISQIRQALTGSALSSIFTGIFSVLACALMFWYSRSLALIALGLVLLSVIVFTSCGILQVRFLRGANDVSGRVAGMTLQFINGIAKFRVAGTEARAYAVWARAFTEERSMSMRARKVSNALSVFYSAFPVFAWSIIFYFGISMTAPAQSQALTTGKFLAFLAAFMQFSTGALDLSSTLISVLSVVPLYEGARPILTSLPEVDNTKTEPGELLGNVDIHHVSFRYREDGPLVLHDVSLGIPAGRFVAIVGPSGSGKSTLLRLLLGFEVPQSGAVYYDGQDIHELDVQAVRRQLGVVMQNARLPAGSILQRIVEGRNLTIDDAWAAARNAGLEADLRAMPMGMHTVITEGGGGLSGGQRQRLLIARAIVNKPRILLFDEATSALDNVTQAIVSRSLNELNATRVVIAHRLSTVKDADRIYVLDKGCLAESGTYSELMAQNGLFAELAKRQLS